MPARRAEFERFLGDVPPLHSWDDGQTWNSGGFGEAHFRLLFDLLEAAPSRALETGAGNSTIAMLLAGAQVVSVAPDLALFARIRDYGARHAIPLCRWQAVADISERALPGLAERARDSGSLVDFVLLDGAHGWPTVFVDFCYGYAMLRQGGHMMVDDIQIHSVKELARFMSRAWQFELVRDLGKTLLFRKVADQAWMGDFGGQRYVMDRMAEDAASGLEHTLF